MAFASASGGAHGSGRWIRLTASQRSWTSKSVYTSVVSRGSECRASFRTVRRIADHKLSAAEVARRIDVGENLLRTREEALGERGDAAFPGHGNPAPADHQLRRLRADVARLRAERDRLEKAAAYFASPPS